MTGRAVATLGAIALLSCVHPTEYPGLGYGPTCADARARALTDRHPAGLTSPVASFLMLPPAPIPKSVDGQTALVDFYVDIYGQPRKDSTRIQGVSDEEYRFHMLQAIAKTTFRPASVSGCAVEGWARLTYQLRAAR